MLRLPALRLFATLLLAPVLAFAQELEPAAAEVKSGGSALSILRQIDEGFVQIFEKVAPSVVVIEAMKRPDPLDEEGELATPPQEGTPDSGITRPQPRPGWPLPQSPSRSEGSGFIIRADGYVLTNLHVVKDADQLTVRLKDGRFYAAKVLGADDKTDIAVLKIEAAGLNPVVFGDSDALRVGQIVCAIGAPFNQDYSFTCGWVSGKGRTNLLGPSSPQILYEDYIQTDAFINPGNSGGPLFDVDGEVIGMNTLINGIGRGLAFAIPANMLQDISSQLIATGKVVRPWLGVRIESLAQNAVLRERVTEVNHGVVVTTIEANAPAYKSDLRPTDIILELDGVKLATAHDLQKEVLRKKVGQTVQLTVWRLGQLLSIPVMTGELPADFSRPAPLVSAKTPIHSKGEIFGLRLKDGKPGAIVVDVADESAAAQADILREDVITAVEGKPVANAIACLAALRTAQEKSGIKGVIVNLERRGKKTFVLLNPNEPSQP